MSDSIQLSLARARARVDQALAAWPERPAGEPKIDRIGLGFTNYNWRATWPNGVICFVKSPGDETGSLIDKEVAVDASIKVGKLGVSPLVLYVDGPTGVEVHDFLDGYRGASPTDFYEADLLEKALQGYRHVHQSTQFLKDATGFQQIAGHRDHLLRLGQQLPANLLALWPQVEAAERAISASGYDLTGCYNDAHITNYMIGPNREVKIIDWEYASNNDPFWDLGSVAFEAFMTEAREHQLVEIYCGSWREDVAGRVYIYKILAMVKWALWALLQSRLSALPYDFGQYAQFLIMRTRYGMDDSRWAKSLASL